MPVYFFFLFPVIIVVLPILALLGIPIFAMLIFAGILLSLFTIFTKWICEGAETTYLWCLLPGGLALLCFLAAHFIGEDATLMTLFGHLIK